MGVELTMVSIRRWAWVAGVVALLVCLAAAYAAYTLAGYSWDQVVSYESPFADSGRPWVEQAREDEDSAYRLLSSEEGTRSPRLVLIIVDGLSLEASREMNALNILREYGSDMVATTGQPSLSYPTWTTILSGAPPEISGVTTNWFEQAVPVETLFDVAIDSGLSVGVVGPEDFEMLYLDGYRGSPLLTADLSPWAEDGSYMSTELVNGALDMVNAIDPRFMVLHLPDADETAHDFGADSDEYREIVGRIDTDVARLVDQLQDERTTFIVTADHGHVAIGGHGGWEDEVTHVPAVFVGRGVASQRNEAMQQVDMAPTVAGLLDVPVPRFAAGRVRADVLVDGGSATARGVAQYRAFAERYLRVIDTDEYTLGGANTYDDIEAVLEQARDDRLARDRAVRLTLAAGVAAAAALVLLVIGALSWRALAAAMAGVVAYYVGYNALYFGVHGHAWSLSAFNTEEYVQTFFNVRMVEAAVAGLVAAFVAASVYPLLRKDPQGPRGTYLGGWLSLGPATVLAVQATLAFQVAWFLWAWGAEVTWRLPDLLWGFKYDLDLIQITALGGAALLAPVVTYVVGRYHPQTHREGVTEGVLASEGRTVGPDSLGHAYDTSATHERDHEDASAPGTGEM